MSNDIPLRPRTGKDEIAIYNRFTKQWRVVKKIQPRKPGEGSIRVLPQLTLKKPSTSKKETKPSYFEIGGVTQKVSEQARDKGGLKSSRIQETLRFKNPFISNRSYFEQGSATQRISEQARDKGGLKSSRINESLVLKDKVKKPKPVSKFTGGTGLITKGEKPKTIQEKLARETEKARQISQDLTKSSIKRIGTGTLTLGALGAVRGVLGAVNVIKKPIEFVKNQAKAISQPLKTLKEVGHQFTIDPAGTITEYIIYSKTLNKIGKATKRSPLGKKVTQELFIRSQPKEIRKYVRNIIESSEIQKKIDPIKGKLPKKITFAEVKSLNNIEAKALTKTLKNSDAVVFGSKAARVTAGKQKSKLPLPKDVDLATGNINNFYKKFIKNSPKKSRKNYILKNQKIIKKSTGKALFDVKPLSRIIPDKSIITKKGYLPVSGYVDVIKKPKNSVLPKIVKKPSQGAFQLKTARLKKIGGIKFVSFGEQTLRKGLGTLQVLIEKNIKRAKDPQSFILSLEIQKNVLKNAKGIANKLKYNKINNALKVLKSKEFEKLLDKKSFGKTKDFPILQKINIKKLNSAKNIIKKLNIKDLKLKNNKLIDKKTNKVLYDISNLPSDIPKSLIQKSYLPLLKTKSSKLPSKLPKSKPSKFPSKIPKKVSSKLPISKLPKSKIPISNVPLSKIPKIQTTISNLPKSDIPKSFIPSIIPKSLIPVSKIPESKLPPSKIPKIKIPESKLPLSKIPEIFIPDIPITEKKFRYEIKIPSKKKKLTPEQLLELLKITPSLRAIENNLDISVTGTKDTYSGLEVRGITKKPIYIVAKGGKTLEGRSSKVRPYKRRLPIVRNGKIIKDNYNLLKRIGKLNKK